MISSHKLPLYLRSNVTKNINVGSLVVNPNVDFTVYKVLLLSNKHMIAIDEKMMIYKFKIKNFVSVDYTFNIQSDILKLEKIPHNYISVSENMFEICEKFIKENGYYEIFEDVQNIEVDKNTNLNINTKIVITSSKSSFCEHHDESEKSISWLDNYATIKIKDTKKRIYLSIARSGKICNI